MGWVHEAVLDTDLLLVGEEIRGYIFPSPLHRWIVARHLIPRTHSTDPPKKIPLQLTLEILRRFVPSSLSDASLSPRSGRPETRTPPEALYGQEFFRAAHKVLKGHCYPSPEFGSFDPEAGKGWIDLYIPAYKFGIEYLHDGSNIQGHASRFLDGGPYKKWIDAGDMIDYIMLDFRLTQPRDQHPMHPKLFHVIFESNFRRVVVKNSVLQIVDTFNLPEVTTLREV
ncbi:hypothetical protein K440DRAFT_321618 [Wilcoxina mikolae CBS 423.85]|nr:hypothetical protein K440DRAFT_321618 [Wilcoxina mikolae CBS 423.85]